MSATMPGEAEFYCPPGQVTLQVGDLIQIDRGPAVVIERNDSCAKVLRLMGKTKVIVNRFTGEPVEITTNPQPERMCMHVDRVMRLKHLTDEEYQDFLDHHQPRAVAGGKQLTTHAATENEVMAVKTFRKKVTQSSVKRGKNENLFGFSATAVLRRLGKEGVTVETATKIFKALKVKVSPVTITAWIGNGKRGQYGAPASLTGEQLKSLLAKA